MIDLPDDQLARVRDIIGQHMRNGEVFAFGSRVTGRAKKFSDLDLMVKTHGLLPWRKLADLRDSFEDSELPITVDVVDWNACTEQFRSQVGPQLVRIR